MRHTLLRLALAALLALPTACYALPPVHITQVEENQDSVRVYFEPVPGAKDYRAYTLDNPKEVKYAGIVHLFAPNGQHWAVTSAGVPEYPYHTVPNKGDDDKPTRLDTPALDIEYNGLEPGQTAKIVVEAVNHIGPSPFSNLATESNVPVSSKMRGKGKMASMTMVRSKSDDMDVMELLGSNAGPTDDGKYSINGQSGPHVTPSPIARSRPVAVRPTGRRALPSTPSAKQVVFDTFGQGHIDEIPGTRDIHAGTISYTMRSDAAWHLDFLQSDISHSRPFIMNRHYMDVLFDGNTPESNMPLHIAHGAMTMSPDQSADFRGGRVLHVTMECDGHIDARRWLAFNITPYNDPIKNLYFEGGKINNTSTALFVQFFTDHIATSLFEGKKYVSLAGALGQAEETGNRPMQYGYDGRGLDNRSRFDLFLMKNRYLVFEDGTLILDQKIKEGLPVSLQHVKIYFTHYLYHTGNEVADVKRSAPWERFWTDLFPYSDERHWDNMGYEVLSPSFAGESSETLGKLIRDEKRVRTIESADRMAQR